MAIQPSADVTVTVTVAAATTGDHTDGSITVKDTDDSQNGNQTTPIVFTNSNWNTARTVTLGAAEDADTNFGACTITNAVTSTTDSNYTGKTATLTATEKEPPLVVQDGSDQDITALYVNEGGFNVLKIKLSAQPSSAVTVYLDLQPTSQGEDDNITLSRSSLTFTTQNYGDAQTVEVRASEDSDIIPGTRTITHRVSGGGYNNARSIVVTATEKENDKGIILSKGNKMGITGLDVPEAGTETYTVRLSVQPNAALIVTITEGSGDTDITVTNPSGNPKTLSFDSADWQTEQEGASAQ